MGLEQLWQLQEIDLAIKALEEEEEHTPLRQELQTATEQVERLRAELAGDEETLKNQRKRLKKLEMDLQKNSDSRAALRKRLYGGEVSNVRELEQMEVKLGLLEKEQQAQEDEALELMEAIESGDAELRGKAAGLQEEENNRRVKETELGEALKRIAAGLEQLRRQKEELAARIEPRLMERYRLLAQKHRGRALARVAGDICGGCGVFISSAQRGFLYNPEALVYCESCGRLLVKLSDPD